jgi:DUF4097 and DUF4098 domain-containing protein YvlB
MKRKNDFTEGLKAKHVNRELSSTMNFIFKILFLTLIALMLASSFIVFEVLADLVEETFEYSGIDELQVDGMFFTLEVSGHTGDSVEGRIAIPQNLHEGNYVEVVHTKSGGVLEVEVKKLKATIPPVSEKALISIRAPRDITINLMTSSGNLAVERFETDTIRLKSSSGKIKAKDLSARIDIASSSGSQDIQQCKGTLTVKSSSGRISVRDVVGNMSVESSSGSQTYREIDGNIRVKSSSGRITINKQMGALDLRTTSGRLEGHEVKLTGDSSFQTSSGRISFEFKNDLDDFSFSGKGDNESWKWTNKDHRKEFFRLSGIQIILSVTAEIRYLFY